MEITLTEYFDELPNDEQCKVAKAPQDKRVVRKARHRPDTDIVFWLTNNAPATFQELVDLRYCLYHRCTRSGFVVKRWDKDDFKLTGRHSSLHIVSNRARRFLLGRLRILAKERGWRGAVPRSGGLTNSNPTYRRRKETHQK
jgi:hypothetical protein